MEYLAHRGLWIDKAERNSLPALSKALDEGFGLETDIRDLNGRLVISHDMPSEASAIPLEHLLHYYKDGGFTSTLALNIKCDGLHQELSRQLACFGITNFFVFDMSIPDTLGYLTLGLRTFIRRSEFEYHPEMERKTQGIWLDELAAPWIDKEIIRDMSSQTEALCIVSSELHGREKTAQWSQIKLALETGCPAERLLLCTDEPRVAKGYFKWG